MSTDLRDYFGDRLGGDLDGVRVHTNSAANQAARSLQARAFTDRQDIVFGPGAWAPHTTSGRQLLAHELTHATRHADSPTLHRDLDGMIWEDRTNRQIIEEAVKSQSVSEAKKITNYGECSEDERIKLIDILLNQGWVGPQDEYALEALWRTAGDLVAFAEKHTAQWFASIDRGAELAELPPVKEYCATFQASALDTTRMLLADSKARITKEMVRYGLSKEDDYTPDLTGEGPGSTSTSYGMSQGPDSVGVKAAAGVLLAKQREVAALTKKQKEYEKEDEIFIYVTVENLANWEAASKALKQAQQDQEILRMAEEAKYPILAAFAADEGGLESIAEGKGETPAAALHKASSERLENITKVQAKLEDEPEQVWKLPPVVDTTKSTLGIEAKSLKDGFVTAKVDKVESDTAIIDLALGALALAFGLLAALPTGGGSLVAAGAAVGAVGAVATSATTAFLHLREYQFKAAASGTDFDKARAVSADDPSMFWLALDIVAVGVDLSAAVGVFRSLAPAARAAAKATRESEAALKTLREAAESAEAGKGAALADRVTASAERMQKAAGSVEETFGAAGAKNVDKTVAEVAAKQAEEAKGAVGVVNKFGGELKAHPLGLFSCASPCTMLREKYLEQLATSPELADELLALEREAAAAAGDAAKLKDIAAKGSLLEGKLRQIPGGSWRSPLSKAAEYSELVKRRGSVAFELDRRPPDWHGADEAAFRYGDRAAAEAGYHWRITPDGELIYVRNNADLPERIFDPVSNTFRAPDPAAIKVTLESEEELVKLAAAGAKAATKAEWLASIRKAVPQVSGLSDEALMRVVGKSPNLDHMRGELLEALAGPGLAKRAAAAGTGAEFVEGHRITDAAGRQLSDGMVIRRTAAGEAEVLVVGESKAGEGAAAGLSADYEGFSSLKPGTPKWNELEQEAIEALREKLKVGLDPNVRMPAWAEAANLRKTHKAEIEAIMRDVSSRDMGQIGRDFERLMPNFGAKGTTILIDGQPVLVKANRATTKVALTTPSDVSIAEAAAVSKEAGIATEALDVGIDSASLEAVARQLRAEQIKNGARLP